MIATQRLIRATHQHAEASGVRTSLKAAMFLSTPVAVWAYAVRKVSASSESTEPVR